MIDRHGIMYGRHAIMYEIDDKTGNDEIDDQTGNDMTGMFT
jgi:hypothetical protein